MASVNLRRTSCDVAEPAPGATVSRLSQSPSLGDIGRIRSGDEGRSLHRGSGGDDLVVMRDGDRPPGQRGQDLAVGRGAGSTSQQDQPAGPSGHAGGLEGVEPVQQAADHPLEGGSGQELAAHVGPDPLQRSGGIGPVRGTFPGQIGHEDQAIAPRGSGEGQIVEFGVVHRQEAAEGRGDERGVEGADQRQIPTGGIGEAGDGSGRVLKRLLARARRPCRRCRSRWRRPPVAVRVPRAPAMLSPVPAATGVPTGRPSAGGGLGRE